MYAIIGKNNAILHTFFAGSGRQVRAREADKSIVYCVWAQLMEYTVPQFAV